MNVTDLTLGNFLYYPEKDIYVTVSGINKNSITVEWIEYKDGVKLESSKVIKDFSKVKYIPISTDMFIYLFKLDMYKVVDSFETTLYKDYTDFLKVITLRETDMMVNRPNDGDNKVWYIHLDNYDYDTIGTGDFIYMHEVQNFFKSVGFDIVKHAEECDKQRTIF